MDQDELGGDLEDSGTSFGNTRMKGESSSLSSLDVDLLPPTLFRRLGVVMLVAPAMADDDDEEDAATALARVDRCRVEVVVGMVVGGGTRLIVLVLEPSTALAPTARMLV